jgi:hypothetical protein
LLDLQKQREQFALAMRVRLGKVAGRRRAQTNASPFRLRTFVTGVHWEIRRRRGGGVPLDVEKREAGVAGL